MKFDDAVVMHSQRGATLLVCLLLLLGLTVVGIASMRETVVQQKAINAAMEDDTAFQAAEYALREGERLIKARASGTKLPSGSVSGVSGLSIKDGDVLALEWWKDRSDAAWSSGVTVTTYPQSISATQRAPSYIVELLQDADNVEVSNSDKTGVYRITARGFGVNDAYYAVVQSIVFFQY